MEYDVLVDKVLKWLVVLVCLGLVLVVLSQALLQFETVRELVVPVEKWEGERISFA